MARSLKEWGTNGSGDGQVKLPHAIATDSSGRLFVADRDNARIVLFDRDGRFLANWTQLGAPSGLHIASDDTLFVAAIGDQRGVVFGRARSGEGPWARGDAVQGCQRAATDLRGWPGTICVADLRPTR